MGAYRVVSVFLCSAIKSIAWKKLAYGLGGLAQPAHLKKMRVMLKFAIVHISKWLIPIQKK